MSCILFVFNPISGGNGNGTFRIDKNTGEIFVVGDLDRETTGFHNIIIKATNNATYVPSGVYNVKSDVTLKEVQIEVKDINDNGPQFGQKIYISSELKERTINNSKPAGNKSLLREC